jgi:D-3-phosphoglycerate dehydrogenase
MMDGTRFAAMRPGALFLNTARAGLHDLDALTDALVSGHLGGAGLDHFDGEQLPARHPLIGLDNVVLTPHIGGATYDTEVTHTAMVADDIARLLAGERPHHCANPEVLA